MIFSFIPFLFWYIISFTLTSASSWESGCGRDAGWRRCPEPQCCSASGYCGKGEAYCGNGCQSNYGYCSMSDDDEDYEQDNDDDEDETGADDRSGMLPLRRVKPLSNQPVRECHKPGLFALTIDDGPHYLTSRVLSILRKYRVKATFFVLITQLENLALQPQTRQALKEGHQIALHDTDHTSFLQISPNDIKDRIARSESVMMRAIGRVPNYFRFPYGDYNDAICNQMSSFGYNMIQWNLDTRDWENRNAETIVRIVRENIAGKASSSSWITLLHDIHEPTVDGLENLIKVVYQNRYKFVTMSECLGDDGDGYFE